MYHENDFLESISSSFLKYKEYGARSTQKLYPIHKYITDILKKIWDDKYEYFFLGEGSKEAKIDGKYYPKDVDIAVFKDGKTIFCLGIKFITSNYKQNANNYFESMMGETANIQANKIPYAHIIVMRYETPYYKKNDSSISSKIEIISRKDIQKYLNLIYDTPQAHRPSDLCIFLVDIDEKTNIVKKTNINNAFGEDFANLIEQKLSPENFFKEIENYKNYIEVLDSTK
ncbi:hypothetical protein [Dyadobacter sp. 3J3]|uniref:hypothetical protein n=1 Tax=Dyadobacter sp. 3J3 TaxID=2606600 RepID=UPI001357D429|nr:hypothetical protein [Dyadobacter sp. 3J3]